MTGTKANAFVRITALAGGACVVLLIVLSVMKLQRGAPSATAAYVGALERANRVDAVFIASSIVFWIGLVIVTARRSPRAAVLVAALVALASGLDVAENRQRVSEAGGGHVILEGSLWATYLAAAIAGVSIGRREPRWLAVLGLLGPPAGLVGLLGVRPVVLLWLLAWHLGGAIFLWRAPSGT